MPRALARPRRTKGILGGRSDEVVRHVVDAAIIELARSGFAEFRMDEVAARAGVNRTTIYRRWPSRVELVTAVVDVLRTRFRHDPLPDTGTLEQDLIEAFARRWEFGRNVEAAAWSRLRAERDRPDVEAIVGGVIDDRSAEWRAMVTRAIERRELPPGTDEQLVLAFVRALVDARGAQRSDVAWLTAAVRTVIAGASAGTLVRAGKQRRARRRTIGR